MLPVQLLASVAVTVKVDLPFEVGVPESNPALESTSPAGSEPLVTKKLYGPVPPLPLSVCEYAVLVRPFGRVRGVMLTVTQENGAVALLRGAGVPVVKSALLSLVSVQPLLFREAAEVDDSAVPVGPVPSKQLGVVP